MRENHPFAILAPFFALAAFGATALSGYLQQADPLTVTVRCIVSSVAANWVTRACAALLGALPSANAMPVAASDGDAGEETQ